MSMNPPSHLFSEPQWKSIADIVMRLDTAQAYWLSGYLAARQAPAAAAPVAAPSLLVTYGTETGNCKMLAGQLHDRLRGQGHAAQIADLSEVRLHHLSRYRHLLVICSTHGDGDPPVTAADFFGALMESRTAPLVGLKYAVLALGDRTYEQFCATGRQIDARLAALQASRLLPCVECDVDFSTTAQHWMDEVLQAIPGDASAETMPLAAAATPASGYSRQQPLSVEVLDNIRLSAAGRSDPIHHIELALNGHELALRPGDAIGVLPENPPALVAAVLQTTGLPAEQPVVVNNQAMPLVQALRETRDLVVPSIGFIEAWASLTEAPALKRLLEDTSKKQREFLRSHQVMDLLSRYPATPDSPTLLHALRPLQPRLYDVANSLRTAEGELHLTVQHHRYTFRNRAVDGIASDYLLKLAPGEQVRIYPHANPRFRLPEDLYAPLIMVADGTGIAPFRAFIQEIQATGRKRPCWLVYTEQSGEEDFLYQLDWQKAHAAGLVKHVETVFLQQQPERTLAGSLISHPERLATWLRNEGHLYLCGSKERLQACELRLKQWFEEISDHAQVWRDLCASKRIHRNLY